MRRGAELINAPKIVGRDGGEEETLVVGKCVDKDVMMSSFAVVLKLSTTKVRRLLASYGFIPVKHLKRRKLSDRYRMFYGTVLRESKIVLPMQGDRWQGRQGDQERAQRDRQAGSVLASLGGTVLQV